MRRFAWFLVAALLVLPSRAEAALSVVAHTNNSISGASPIVNITSTGSGHLIVVMIDDKASSSTVTSVTDNQSGCGGYTQVPSSSTIRSDAWYCNNSVSATTVVTINFDIGTASGGATVYEISGQDTGTVVDAHGTDSQVGSTPTGAPVTTSTAHTFIATTVSASGGVASVLGIHSGNAFTEEGHNNNGTRGWGGAYMIASSASTYTPQWDFDASDTAITTTVAFKEAGGGGGGTFPGAIINVPVRGGGRPATSVVK